MTDEYDDLDVNALRALLRKRDGQIIAIARKLIDKGERPTQIHPEDVALTHLPLDERVAIHRDIMAGKIEVTPNAPRDAFVPPRKQYTHEEYRNATLTEKGRIDDEIIAGKAELV